MDRSTEARELLAAALAEDWPWIAEACRKATPGNSPTIPLDGALRAIEAALSQQADLIEKLRAVAEAARAMPRATPAAGSASTVHPFQIEAHVVWSLDRALTKLDQSSTLPDTMRDERAGWLPIETFIEPTALSSGNGVLVADKDGAVGEAYYRNFGDPDDGWWWANTSWGDYPEPDRPDPTSWRPLPDPPAIESSEHLKDRGEGK